MLPLAFDSIDTLLCLGAHCDDIEIGAGATVRQLVEKRPQLRVHWVIFSGDGERAVEARNSADVFLADCGDKQIEVLQFRNGYFPWIGADIKDFFESLKQRCSPDLILTHYRGDRHQDHQTISDLTWNTFRDHLILEYEIPKFDGDLGQPQCYVPIGDEDRNFKVRALMDQFPSQHRRTWFNAETFNALMRLRGIEAQSETGYAEAFYARKFVVR